MSEFRIVNAHLTLDAEPSCFRYTFTLPDGRAWSMTKRPFIRFSDGSEFPFPVPETAEAYRSGTFDGIKCVYTGFGGAHNGLRAVAHVKLDRTTGDVLFTLNLTGDNKCEIHRVSFPAPLDFGAEPGCGYTVLPRMHGTLIPAGEPIRIMDGQIYERDGYMPLFGQVRDGSGYAAIYETPFDAMYEPDGDRVAPLWRTSLGKLNYPRKMRYCFRTDCDYNVIAKCYRAYLKERGMLVTLREKFDRNPKAERIVGAPVLHSCIAVHIVPESHFYDPDDPANNDHWTTFDERAEELRALKARGLDKAYTHYDGWGSHGYDNLHPSPFPPHEAAGGAEGMKRLADTCRELGYIFGIHDQYRDCYYDNPDFRLEEAVTYADGGHPFHDFWNGGKHTFLCSEFAPDYVRRNYDQFEQLGINVEAAYLDVFSVVEMDECFHPDHPVTREQCARNRRHALDILTDRGIIPSSEEALDCIIPSLILCHHAPFCVEELGSYTSKAVGVPIPLLSLVYHDCFIVPWIGLPGERGGWCVPVDDCPYTYAMLYGQPVYCPGDASVEDIKAVKAACDNAARLTHCELVRHEFVDGNYRVQRTTFSDGTIITANLDTCEVSVDR